MKRSSVAMAICLLLTTAHVSQTNDEFSQYEQTLIAAVHLFAADGQIDHVKAIPDQHPSLVNQLKIFPQPRKPLLTDGFTALHRAAANGESETSRRQALLEPVLYKVSQRRMLQHPAADFQLGRIGRRQDDRIASALARATR